MSKKWRGVDRSIQMGLIQELFIRLLSRYPEFKSSAKKTVNIDLYHNFLRSVHIAIEKTESDPILSNAFDQLNDVHFFGMLDRPNLRWGQESYRKLGSYDFGTDTITMSRALDPQKTGDHQILAYVLYHEMLHKKHKFNSSGLRTCSHSKAFREDEARFPDAKGCEGRLKQLRPGRIIPKASRPHHVSHPFGRLIERILG